jgi:hypothetical protein
MNADRRRTKIDEPTIELIAARVAMQLREELQAIAAELAHRHSSERPLTVEDVAERFGVARSTVYAHWREWGGYRLGNGAKSPIRFPADMMIEQGSDAASVPRNGNAVGGSSGSRHRIILQEHPPLPVRLGDASPSTDAANSRTPRGPEA